MPKVIIDRSIVESPFELVDKENADPQASHVLLPLRSYLEHRSCLQGRDDVGVWLDADEEVEEIADFVNCLPVVGLNFPTFFDGRSLSSASIIRRRFGYRGELRAVGDVRRDQLEQMRRCGFNAFHMAEGQDLSKALESLDGFTYRYQGSVDQPEPLFRTYRHR